MVFYDCHRRDAAVAASGARPFGKVGAGKTRPRVQTSVQAPADSNAPFPDGVVTLQYVVVVDGPTLPAADDYLRLGGHLVLCLCPVGPCARAEDPRAVASRRHEGRPAICLGPQGRSSPVPPWSLDLLTGLLLPRNRVGIAGELHDVPFDCSDELEVDVVVVALVIAAAVLLGQFDAIAFDHGPRCRPGRRLCR